MFMEGKVGSILQANIVSSSLFLSLRP
uniref:Uncharacterized protein n=1 Tax=Anguilla anguilla TaxID=7936 RepID=A0A0E9Q8Y6_ANGAN